MDLLFLPSFVNRLARGIVRRVRQKLHICEMDSYVRELFWSDGNWIPRCRRKGHEGMKNLD